jgi:hypothetical protein
MPRTKCMNQWAGGRFCPGFFFCNRWLGWAVGELCYLTQHAKRPSKWTEFRVATFEISLYLFFWGAKFKLEGVSNHSLGSSASLHRPRRISVFSYKHRSTKDYMRPGQKLNKRGIFVWLTQGHQTSDSYDYGPCLVAPIWWWLIYCSTLCGTVAFCFYLVKIVQTLTNWS